MDNLGYLCLVVVTILSNLYVLHRVNRLRKKTTETNENYFTRLYGSYFNLATNERLIHASHCALYNGKFMHEQHRSLFRRLMTWVWKTSCAMVFDDKPNFEPPWLIGITTHKRVVLAVGDEEGDFMFESEWRPGVRVLTDMQALGLSVKPSIVQLGFGCIGSLFVMLSDSVLERRRGLWVSPAAAAELIQWSSFYGSVDVSCMQANVSIESP